MIRFTNLTKFRNISYRIQKRSNILFRSNRHATHGFEENIISIIPFSNQQHSKKKGKADFVFFSCVASIYSENETVGEKISPMCRMAKFVNFTSPPIPLQFTRNNIHKL